jgi:hypothetical protein
MTNLRISSAWLNWQPFLDRKYGARNGAKTNQDFEDHDSSAAEKAMTNWVWVPLDFEPLPGASDVFVKAINTFSANSLAKKTLARDRNRQAHFEGQLRQVAWHLGTKTVPVFLNFNGVQLRMDKGCVGHAVAAGFLLAPVDGPDGYVTQVELSSE